MPVYHQGCTQESIIKISFILPTSSCTHAHGDPYPKLQKYLEQIPKLSCHFLVLKHSVKSTSTFWHLSQFQTSFCPAEAEPATWEPTRKALRAGRSYTVISSSLSLSSSLPCSYTLSEVGPSRMGRLLFSDTNLPAVVADVQMPALWRRCSVNPSLGPHVHCPGLFLPVLSGWEIQLLS